MPFHPAGNTINTICLLGARATRNKGVVIATLIQQPQQETSCGLLVQIHDVDFGCSHLGGTHYTNYTHKQKLIIAREFPYLPPSIGGQFEYCGILVCP